MESERPDTHLSDEVQALKASEAARRRWQAEKEKDDFATFLFLMFVLGVAAMSVSC